MDFLAITTPLLSTLWFLIPLIIVFNLFRSAWFKGVVGEFIVNMLLQYKLDQDIYHLFKNVTLPTENDSTQIDHIIVSVFGVFVIETKNMRGRIYGKPNDPMWTQQIYNHKNKFQNPLRQNYKHIKTLQKLLQLSEPQLHSVIAFIGDSEFKAHPPPNVTQGIGLLRHIKAHKDFRILPKDKERIISAIENGRLSESLQTNRQHAKHVKDIIAGKKELNLCPKCGNKMVMRHTKSGHYKSRQFWGCASFPTCRTVIPFIE